MSDGRPAKFFNQTIQFLLQSDTHSIWNTLIGRMVIAVTTTNGNEGQNKSKDHRDCRNARKMPMGGLSIKERITSFNERITSD